MNLDQVDRVGRYIESKVPNTTYAGCHLLDECDRILPPTGSSDTSFGIVNTLTSTSDRSTMGHYLLLAFNSHQLFFFDSFGLPLHTYPHWLTDCISYWKGRGFQFVTHGRRLQAMDSLLCGLYSLYTGYIFARVKGSSLTRSVLDSLFSVDYRGNDRRIISICYGRLGLPLPPYTTTFCDPSVASGGYTSCIMAYKRKNGS